MAQEHELKMVAGTDTVLPDLTGVAPGVVLGPTLTQEMVADYYDTPTLALARWGASLRWRDERPTPIWTVKLPEGSDKSVVSRCEVTFAGHRTKVPARAAELIRVFRRGQPLGLVANVRTNRSDTSLLIDGVSIATVSDDLVMGEPVNGPSVSFREIEVEVATEVDADSMLRALRRRLQQAGCQVENPVLSKVVRVLGSDAQRKPDVHVMNLSRRATVGDLVSNVLAGSLEQLIQRDPLIRAGDEPEDLHDFRVAARRFRSDLTTFAPVLEPTWARPLREELRWIGTAAGVVRDADVLQRRLRDRFQTLSPGDTTMAVQLLARLANVHGRGRSQLLRAMSTDRYDALIEVLIAATRQPHFVDDDEKIPAKGARPVMSELVEKRWRRLKTAAGALDVDSPDLAWHEVRILTKRCRYASEAASVVFGKDARRFSRALADVQEVLGSFQDTVIAEEWLRAAAKANPATGLLVGLTIAEERCDRRLFREQFASVWDTARDPELRCWLR